MDLPVYKIDVLRLRSILRFRPTAPGQMVQAAVEERYKSLDTDENRHKSATAIEERVFGLEEDLYTRFRGEVRSAGRLDEVLATITLEAELLGAVDRFTFRLRYAPAGEQFDVVEADKQPQGFGSDGCVPVRMRALFNSKVVKDPTVFEVAERFGRVIDEREVRWDWQPRWNFARARLSGRLAEKTLASLFEGSEEAEVPEFVLHATWSFSTLKRDWGEDGRFVRLVIDPRTEEVIHRLGDDWCLLY